MKKIILSAGILFAATIASAQILNQDADGKSSIVVTGGTLSMDINEGLIKANYYHSTRKSKGYMLGVDMQAKNDEGLASLFSEGNFSPDGELSVLGGYHFSWQGHTPAVTNRMLVYLRLGVKASEFKYDMGNTYTTLKTRFVDTQMVGHNIQLGTSLRFGGKWHIGLQVGNDLTNNRSELKKSVYKYTMNDTTLPGLQQTKDVTAYSGTYGTYYNTYVNVDLLYAIDVAPNDENDNNLICPSLYFRHNISGDNALKKNNTVLGASVNFVNSHSGKFMGGIYLQTDDLFKTDNDQFSKTIRFGLVAKFSLSTIAQ